MMNNASDLPSSPRTTLRTLLRVMLALAGVCPAMPAVAQATFYERADFDGRSFTTKNKVSHFERHGFHDRAVSADVFGDRWEVCVNVRFGGQCMVLRHGRYPSPEAMGLNHRVSSARPVGRQAQVDDRRYAPVPLAAQITFFEHEGFKGRSYTTEKQIANFERNGFNDRASSVEVLGDRWEVCENAQFGGRCVVLLPGRYASLAAMALSDRISSVRAIDLNAQIDDLRYAPRPGASHDYRRRSYERLYTAKVTSVRAVLDRPEQRCWIEREAIVEASRARRPGALTGGILGHQAGSGQPAQDVQRCADVPSQDSAEYWDVSYIFRGQAHRVQVNWTPGVTVSVNEQGEPRTP